MKNEYYPKKTRHNMYVFIFLFCLNCVFTGHKLKAQTTDYQWKNAPIGGGGFVTGIVTHKTSGERYCRTDVGGAYRWDAANNKWVQLLDWLSESELGFVGVEALAVDPQNANTIYMLCGTDYLSQGRTAVLKSTDKGNTFTYTDVTGKFKAHGNGGGRSNGERLAVDPINSNILYCGTRSNGLWKSTDAGVSWNLAWNGVTTTANGNGICFVLFDPSSNVVNGVSQTIYVGISRTGGANLYKSTNGGASFTDISPTIGFMPHRAAIQGSTLYVTYANGEGPNLGEGSGKVYRLNTSTGVWTNVTPSHSKDYPYGGVSIDPTNANRVIVSTCGMYWNNQFGTGWGDFVFLSTDGGATWTLKNGSNSTYDANGMEWSRGGAINWMDCIEFDQNSLNRVRVIGGGGIYTCPDITAVNTSWKYDVVGIEETALLDGVSIPGGPFISAFGDVSGFVHQSLTSVPSSRVSPSGGYNNNSIAYAGSNPNKVVRVANEGNVVYYSGDKGATWTAAAANAGTAGRVSLSADGSTILHCPWGSSTTYYSSNNGASWLGCSGVSVADAAPVADQVNSNNFYIYSPRTGQFFRSTNKGASFSEASPAGASTADHPWESALARTVPGLEGHIWIPLGRNGLKYSTNAGSSYVTVANVTYCKSIGIGKIMSGANYPTVFIWGTVSGVTGLFRSTNQGNTWTRINNDSAEFGGAPLLVGDMNVEGRVLMSAGGGRGVIYWEPSACAPSAITPYVQINGGTWQQTAGVSLAQGSSLKFGPQPVTGGSWSWSGPNNFSSSAREVSLSNIQGSQAGSYTATYTNSSGCKSTQIFNVAVTGSIIVRARGTKGDETIDLRVGGNTVATWTLTTSFADYTASGSGTVAVHFTNDNTGRDVQIDNVTIGGVVYQSENQQVNTGVWTGACGGSNSEWLNCNGYISYTESGNSSAKMSVARTDTTVPQNYDNQDVIIYPNPSHDGIFQLIIPEAYDAKGILIYDMNGYLVYEQHGNGNEQVLVNSKLRNGFYVVKIQSDKAVVTRKLIVK
ncbi:T9SS type A sorting domain-containing protein [Flavobacterium phragmitis]|uniref:Por secretion system C-terminal sorting domain-containing protein n=1 Tax=Flavobacterium phragmitis TaxID=739143 RepID=A0A1I1XVG1_9FLAO|nr:T9SS type A sorting domain-containing protein [Flavobacterium phragmitis]SFE09540.1 Por secretion system C-terminal sorting domain-containing protein [Flavobacterium phragmitis]